MSEHDNGDWIENRKLVLSTLEDIKESVGRIPGSIAKVHSRINELETQITTLKVKAAAIIGVAIFIICPIITGVMVKLIAG